MISLDDGRTGSEQTSAYIRQTPLLPSEAWSRTLGANDYLKCESLHDRLEHREKLGAPTLL